MKNKDNSHLYLGRAGQLFVVSEFLLHGWNAAIPEVDTGDDVFVVRDPNGEFRRIQVKTVTGVKRVYGYSAKFILNLTQVKTPKVPDLIYFLVVRLNESWISYFVIDRSVLEDFVENKNVGTKNENKNTLQLYFVVNKRKVVCSKKDFNGFQKSWKLF